MKKKKILAICLAIMTIFTVSVFAVNAATFRDEHVSSVVPGCEEISRYTFSSTSGRLYGYSHLATDGSEAFTDFLGKAAVVCTVQYVSNGTHTKDAEDSAYMYYNAGNDPSYYCQATCEVDADLSHYIDYITTDHSYYVNNVHRYTFQHFLDGGEFN